MFTSTPYEPADEVELEETVARMSGDESRLKRLLRQTMWQAGALWRMVSAYVRGEYRAVPWASVAAAAGAVAYLLAPLDGLPDFLPGIGLLDDGIVIAAVASALSVDVARFIAWERQRES